MCTLVHYGQLLYMETVIASDTVYVIMSIHTHSWFILNVYNT